MFETIEGRLKAAITGAKPHRHKFYAQTVEHAQQMGVHVEGETPEKLLEEKRPNEPTEVRDYRLKVWKNVTESLAGKIVNTVAKIFDPKLFRVEFTQERPSRIPEAEDLEKYLTEDFGIWKSIWIYIRETNLVKLFSDPNALCVVMPENPQAEGNEFFRPVPFIFKSEYVVDFVEDEFYILWIPQDKNKQGNRKPDKLWLIDKESIKVWAVKGNDFGGKKLILELPTGFLPAFRLGGVVKGNKNPYWFKSFIYGIQPHWDKVVNMVSDLDGSIVNHLFPSMWEWQIECENCKGTGNVEQVNKNNILTPSGSKAVHEVVCNKCSGSGQVTNKSPFGIYSIKRDAIVPDVPPPAPPAGYITKDLGPLTELKSSIEDAILAGYSSVNMEILFKVGENQSGIAKTIDRSDFDSFLLRISQHVFDCNVWPIIEFTARWRYGTVFENAILQLDEYIRSISISKPLEFSVLGANFLMDELKNASGSNVSDNYLRKIESDLIMKKFANNEFEKKKNLAIVNLKPWPSKTEDGVSLGLARRTIKEEDAIRQDNIDELVAIALDENDDFLNLKRTEQIEILNKIIFRDFLPKAVQTIPVEGAEKGDISVQDVGEDIPGEDIPERPNIEAEAKARLKGSVGGVQGILQIQQSVAAGVTQYDAAVALMSEIFGFQDAVARQILGNESEIRKSLSQQQSDG